MRSSGDTELEAALPRTARLIREGIERGWHAGVMVYASIEGRVVVNDAIGQAAPEVPLTRDTVLPWLSAGKPLTAVAILQLVEAGRLDLDDAVAERVPEFGQNEKDGVTLRHLLTHTGGIQPIASGWPSKPWNEIIDRICRARLKHGWQLGVDAAYDPQRSWFLLGEVLSRLEDKPIGQALTERIGELLGLDEACLSLSKSDEEQLGSRLGRLHAASEGNWSAGNDWKVDPIVPSAEAAPSPGSSWRGTARELGRFYEMLLRGGVADSGRVLQEETVKLLTGRQREGRFDQTFQHVVDFGLGVIVDSNRYGTETVPYGFGRHCSPGTFGHGGSQSSIGFADPAHGLATVVIANGRPGEEAHQVRNRELNSALYEDLGLTSYPRTRQK